MLMRPHRPRLAEAVAVASGWSIGDAASMLARDGYGEYTLIYEFGIDRVEPNSIVRTPILQFPSHDPNVVWSRLVAAGLVPGVEPGRSFACAECDGTGKTRHEGSDGEMSYIACVTCNGKLVFDLPPRVTYALVLASDWARIAKFEKRVRKDASKELSWRISRNPERVEAEEAMKGPRYRLDKPDPARFWAICPEL